MLKLPGGILGVSLFILTAFADDQKSAEPKSRKEQFQALTDEFLKRQADAFKAIEAAKTPEERKEAAAKRPKGDEYAARLMKLVEIDPKDDLSCEMLVFSVRNLRTTNPKVFDLLSEYHVKNQKIAPIVVSFNVGPPDLMKKLLEEIYNRNPVKGIKGMACFGLAMMAYFEADRGNKESAKKAEKLFETFIDDFADIDVEKYQVSAKKFLFELRNLSVGKTIPELVSKDLDDKEVKLSSYRGKVVVLDIWTTWCVPCCEMIPHEREIVKRLEGKPFALISISRNQKKEALTDFIKKEPMPWTHWWDGEKGGILEEWNVQSLPAIFVLDAKGVIRYKGVRDKEMDAAVTTLLAEMGVKVEEKKKRSSNRPSQLVCHRGSLAGT
jgi:thiol-disulfide isomerase/thioredoxin